MGGALPLFLSMPSLHWQG